jgi:hypothetical protein
MDEKKVKGFTFIIQLAQGSHGCVVVTTSFQPPKNSKHKNYTFSYMLTPTTSHISMLGINHLGN